MKNKLTKEDLRTPAITKVRDEMEERLASLRRKNDNVMGNDETNIIRGKISQVKAVLKLLDIEHVTKG